MARYPLTLRMRDPVGASLHMCMTPHGPDAATFHTASTAELKPQKIPDTTLAFMFEA